MNRLLSIFERHNLVRDLLLGIVAVAMATGLRLLLTPILYDRAAFVLFALAVMITSWTSGWRVGLITTALATIVGMLLFVLPFTEPITRSLQNEALVVLFAAEGCGISYLAGQLHAQRFKAQQEARDAIRAREELEAALAHVRTLRGLIPICAWCKKIRNDQGYWEQLELYITNHSEADFTHGMCPDCARKNTEALDLARAFDPKHP